MEKQVKRAFGVVLALTLLFSQSPVSFAKEEIVNKEAFAYLRPDIKIKMDDKYYVFYDANEKNVYPIIYANSAYLPLRGVSAMIDKNIEWEGSNKTIYIGKTLKEPYSEKRIKKSGEIGGAVPINPDRYIQPLENKQIMVNIRNDIRVLYNFEEKLPAYSQNYSLNYNWTIYLPIRKVSDMTGLDIDWDAVENTVILTSPKKIENEGDSKGDKEKPKDKDKNKDEKSEAEKLEHFKKVVLAEVRELDELHKRSTDNLVALRKENDESKQKMYAEEIAQICAAVEHQKSSNEIYKKEYPSEQEQALVDGVKDYIEMLYHYTLIMENIAYLAATGQDFSMLSETFVDFAVQTQTKRQNVSTLLEKIK